MIRDHVSRITQTNPRTHNGNTISYFELVDGACCHHRVICSANIAFSVWLFGLLGLLFVQFPVFILNSGQSWVCIEPRVYIYFADIFAVCVCGFACVMCPPSHSETMDAVAVSVSFVSRSMVCLSLCGMSLVL